ncbi:hypothetical protein IC582_028675 [Cucumis melo]
MNLFGEHASPLFLPLRLSLAAWTLLLSLKLPLADWTFPLLRTDSCYIILVGIGDFQARMSDFILSL